MSGNTKPKQQYCKCTGAPECGDSSCVAFRLHFTTRGGIVRHCPEAATGGNSQQLVRSMPSGVYSEIAAPTA